VLQRAGGGGDHSGPRFMGNRKTHSCPHGQEGSRTQLCPDPRRIRPRVQQADPHRRGDHRDGARPARRMLGRPVKQQKAPGPELAPEPTPPQGQPSRAGRPQRHRPGVGDGCRCGRRLLDALGLPDGLQWGTNATQRSYQVSECKLQADQEQADRENAHEHRRTNPAPAPLPDRDAEAGRHQGHDRRAERCQW
jgi:hypothetical protein